jgi:hypothetical protein
MTALALSRRRGARGIRAVLATVNLSLFRYATPLGNFAAATRMGAILIRHGSHLLSSSIFCWGENHEIRSGIACGVLSQRRFFFRGVSGSAERDFFAAQASSVVMTRPQIHFATQDSLQAKPLRTLSSAPASVSLLIVLHSFWSGIGTK